jgi:hypothetical protein
MCIPHDSNHMLLGVMHWVCSGASLCFVGHCWPLVSGWSWVLVLFCAVLGFCSLWSGVMFCSVTCLHSKHLQSWCTHADQQSALPGVAAMHACFMVFSL